MRKYLLLVLSFLSLQAQNWKRVPGSSDDLWGLREESARGSVAALDFKASDLMGDTFEELLQEKSAAGEPLRVVQVLPDLPEGREMASYYFGDTWRDYLANLETPLVYGYGLGSNAELLDQLRDEYLLSQSFIDELVAMDPQAQIVALERANVPQNMVELLRNAFLRQYTLDLKDPNTNEKIRAQREFFIADPQGHLWPNEELARLERDFLAAVESGNAGRARTTLVRMRGANADRLFMEELESKIAGERVSREEPRIPVVQPVVERHPVSISQEERVSEDSFEGIRNYLLAEIDPIDHAVVNQFIDSASRGIFISPHSRLRTGKALNLLTRFAQEMETSYYYPRIIQAIGEMRLDEALRLISHVHGAVQRDYLWGLHGQARRRQEQMQEVADDVAPVDMRGEREVIEEPVVGAGIEEEWIGQEVVEEPQVVQNEFIDADTIFAAEIEEPVVAADIRDFLRRGLFADARANLSRIQNPLLLQYFIDLIEDGEFLASF